METWCTKRGSIAHMCGRPRPFIPGLLLPRWANSRWCPCLCLLPCLLSRGLSRAVPLSHCPAVPEAVPIESLISRQSPFFSVTQSYNSQNSWPLHSSSQIKAKKLRRLRERAPCDGASSRSSSCSSRCCPRPELGRRHSRFLQRRKSVLRRRPCLASAPPLGARAPRSGLTPRPSR